jgi:prepilin-type processing-associated H-X9-DG protein
MILAFLEQNSIYNALNFTCLPWAHNLDFGTQNSTAVLTRITVFLCPSDIGFIADQNGNACNNYRACAGTIPINLFNDATSSNGRNNGLFWFQSSVHIASIVDGMSTTATFSERCLGNSSHPDPLGDIYEVDAISYCADAGQPTATRYDHSLEWSGQRWSDGNAFYTRYHHYMTPPGPSCTTGAVDYSGDLTISATSRHPGGVNLLAADGSVRFVKYTISPPTWRALGTIAGGEVVDLE